ncbi:restriction endonuclease [Pseudomonas californiensis]|uniref:restriction endonuclease n=1 Tax=Pseudomonas californiensis TaxID=2829823 RepID=UPI001E4C9E25|nr:restriction endonuclease [Pseudomonas californiensis]
MINSRVGGTSEIQLAALAHQESTAPVSSAHPNAVTPSNNPPLTPNQSARLSEPEPGTRAGQMGIARQYTERLAQFEAEQAQGRQGSSPVISEHAAVLIGSMLEVANKDRPLAEHVGFELLAERLSPSLALKQFHASGVSELLAQFTRPGASPDKAAVGLLLKTHAQSVTHQLEHFQLMHDASAGSAADRTTLAVSQAAFGEYAGRAGKAIDQGLTQSITTLDERIAALDTTLAGEVDSASRPVLQADKQALVEARATLKDVQTDFAKSPEAKRLKSVVNHTQLDTQAQKLNAERNAVGGLKGAGPIVAAAIPQFLSSMTHLGFIRSATNDKMQDTVPGSSSDASMLKAAVVGLVAGIAHEGVTNLVKPLMQAGLQATGLNERLNMVPLKGVDTESVIPDPFEFKNEGGRMVRKPDAELAADKAYVAQQRAVLDQKKVQVSSTHPLGEFIPYASFGGGQAVRQLLNDFNQINGQTVTARAIASGFAGAVSATAQTLYQLNATYTDPQGRTVPVFTPDKKEAKLGEELAKGLNPLDAGVRTSFYSKAVSGIQSSALTAELPATSKANPGGTLSGGKIVGNMALAALGSVTYLSTLYANQSVTAEAKALKAAGEGGATPMLERSEVPLNNIRHPNRASLPHTSSQDRFRGLPRIAENAYHVARGALQLPSQVAVDMLRTVEDGALSGLSSLRDKLKTETPPQVSVQSPPGYVSVETPRISEQVPPSTPPRITPTPPPLTPRTQRPAPVAPPDDAALQAMEEGLLPTPEPDRTPRTPPQRSVPNAERPVAARPLDDASLRALEEGLLQPASNSPVSSR